MYLPMSETDFINLMALNGYDAIADEKIDIGTVMTSMDEELRESSTYNNIKERIYSEMEHYEHLLSIGQEDKMEDAISVHIRIFDNVVTEVYVVTP